MEQMTQHYVQIYQDWKEEWNRERLEMRNRPDLSDAERHAYSKEPPRPQRKRPPNKATDYGFDSEEHFKLFKYMWIKKFIDCPSSKQARSICYYILQHVELLAPGDFVALLNNHCATQWTRCHFNLHAHNGCRPGFDMDDCRTVIGARGVNGFFRDLTSISCGDFVEDLINFNLEEFCRTLDVRFQRCGPGVEERTGPIVVIIQRFLYCVSAFKANALLLSTAGKTSNAQKLVLDRLICPPGCAKAKSVTVHLQYAGVLMPDMDLETCTRILFQQFTRLSEDTVMPFLAKLGIKTKMSLIDYLIQCDDTPLITNDSKTVEGEFDFHSSKSIKSILNACWRALKRNADALVEDLQDGDDPGNDIKRYIRNHFDQMCQRFGGNDPRKFAVRDVLRNMGTKTQELMREQLGKQGYTDRMSTMGKAGAPKFQTEEQLPLKFKPDLKRILELRKEPIYRPGNFASKYAGVSRVSLKGGGYKWVAKIQLSGSIFRLGTYDSEIEAGSVYAGALCLYSKFMSSSAKFNT